jgi:GNAT superfamily N-acetyltransferase
MDAPVQLEAMNPGNTEQAVELIRVAMNGIEARFARRTMDFHFGCQTHGLDDGRSYWVYRQGERILGLVGLHHYIWGPRENVWLTWFCVAPAVQRQGLGTALLAAAQDVARKLGHRKFFVETYDMADFAAARAFYEKQGFVRAGQIADYLPNRANMIVYLKLL